MRTTEVMRTIPDDAALVFEFNNEKSFYDIFKGNELFTNVIGEEQIGELDTLRGQLLNHPGLEPFFTGQNVFISFHPLKSGAVELLLTSSATNKFNPGVLEELAKKSSNKLLITDTNIDGKQGYTVYSKHLKKRFYIITRAEGIYAGSFSKELLVQSTRYVPQPNKQTFIQLSNQQSANSLANLYVNYGKLDLLWANLFKNKNNDIFKGLRMLPALGVLDLNFKSDALMFNGYTEIQADKPVTYFNLFLNQQPVVNQLKDIFPATTAYSVNFAVSDPKKFKADLSAWQTKAGLQHEKDSVFARVKTETGINLINEFNRVLGNEFAVVTTRFMERLAIISLTDGSKLKPVLYNLSTMADDNMGQLNFNKLPYFLLGDAFSPFNHPWFMVIDNYLVLANTKTELQSYADVYLNRKFQSKLSQFNKFNTLVTERSNIAWYINFKNSQNILKRDLSDTFLKLHENKNNRWKNFYSASYQLSASGKNYYTSFCMGLNIADSSAVAQ